MYWHLPYHGILAANLLTVRWHRVLLGVVLRYRVRPLTHDMFPFPMARVRTIAGPFLQAPVVSQVLHKVLALRLLMWRIR